MPTTPCARDLSLLFPHTSSDVQTTAARPDFHEVTTRSPHEFRGPYERYEPNRRWLAIAASSLSDRSFAHTTSSATMPKPALVSMWHAEHDWDVLRAACALAATRDHLASVDFATISDAVARRSAWRLQPTPVPVRTPRRMNCTGTCKPSLLGGCSS